MSSSGPFRRRIRRTKEAQWAADEAHPPRLDESIKRQENSNSLSPSASSRSGERSSLGTLPPVSSMAAQTEDTKTIRFYADVSSDCSELLVVVKQQKDNGWNQNEAKALKNSGGKRWSGCVSWNSCEFPVEYRYIAKLGEHHYWASGNAVKTRDVPGAVTGIPTDTPHFMVRDDLHTIMTRTQPSNDEASNGQDDLLKRFEAKFDDMEGRLEDDLLKRFEATFDDMEGRLEAAFNGRIDSTCVELERRIKNEISRRLADLYDVFETKSGVQRQLTSHAEKFEEKIEQVLARTISEMPAPKAAMTGAKEQQNQSSTPWSLFFGPWNSWASEVDETRQKHASILEDMQLQHKALQAASYNLSWELNQVAKKNSVGLESYDDKLKELKTQVEEDLSNGLKRVDDKVRALKIEEIQGQISQMETTLGQIDDIKKDLQSQLGQINSNRVELSNIRKKVNYLADDFNELKEQFEAETSKREPSDPVSESQTTPLEASADPAESELLKSQSSPSASPTAAPPARAPAAAAATAAGATELELPHQMPSQSQETEAASGPANESPSSTSPTVPLQPPQRSPTSSEASAHVPPAHLPPAPVSSSSVPTQSSSSIPDQSMPPTPPLNQTSQNPPASAPAQGGGGSAWDAPTASHFEAEGLSPEKATAAVELCAIVLSQLKQAMMDYKLDRGEKPTSMTIKSQLLRLHSDKGGDSEIKDAAFRWFRKYWCQTLGHQAWYLRLVG